MTKHMTKDLFEEEKAERLDEIAEDIEEKDAIEAEARRAAWDAFAHCLAGTMQDIEAGRYSDDWKIAIRLDDKITDIRREYDFYDPMAKLYELSADPDMYKYSGEKIPSLYVCDELIRIQDLFKLHPHYFMKEAR